MDFSFFFLEGGREDGVVYVSDSFSMPLHLYLYIYIYIGGTSARDRREGEMRCDLRVRRCAGARKGCQMAGIHRSSAAVA